MPAQQRVRRDQPAHPQRPGEQPGQGGEDRAVCPVQLRPGVLPPQHGDLGIDGPWSAHLRGILRRSWYENQVMLHATLPAEGLVANGRLPGVGWSDHWSFWQERVPSVMITDTAPSRNHCYHRDCDVPERLDYERMARLRIRVGKAERITAGATLDLQQTQ